MWSRAASAAQRHCRTAQYAVIGLAVLMVCWELSFGTAKPKVVEEDPFGTYVPCERPDCSAPPQGRVPGEQLVDDVPVADEKEESTAGGGSVGEESGVGGEEEGAKGEGAPPVSPSASPGAAVVVSGPGARPSFPAVRVGRKTMVRDVEAGIPAPTPPTAARALRCDANGQRSVPRGDGEFAAVLRRASVRHTVLLSMGDRGFLSMLRNLIATSVVPQGLRNVVIVAMESNMCEELLADGHFPGAAAARSMVECWTYPGGDALKGGSYGTAQFAKLVNVKSELVLESVRLGYHTLLVDGDIVFLKNPLDVLLEQSPDPDMGVPRWDVQIQDDAEGNRNSGLMHVKASPWGLVFICEAVQRARDKPGTRQQPAVNAALVDLAGKWAQGGAKDGAPLAPPPGHKSPTPLSLRILDTARFPCGKAYFEEPRRMFADDNPCTACVVLHNNWIVSTAAKVFRFRESLQWLVDSPRGWYSDPDVKYLQFSAVGDLRVPADSAAFADVSLSRDEELAALGTAFRIAHALRRVLILPDFRCHGCRVEGSGGTKEACSGRDGDLDRCSFLAHFAIRDLELAMAQRFPFREHMFRYNPLVPPTVRLVARDLPGWSSSAPTAAAAAPPPTPFLEPPHERPIFLQTPGREFALPRAVQDPVVVKVASQSTDDIVSALHAFRDQPVLRLAHLKGLSVRLPQEDHESFERAWKAAIKRNTPRQYE